MKPVVHILPMAQSFQRTLKHIRRENWEALIHAACNAPTGTRDAIKRSIVELGHLDCDEITTTVVMQIYDIFRTVYRDVWRLTWLNTVTEVLIQGQSLYIVMKPKPRRVRYD